MLSQCSYLQKLSLSEVVTCDLKEAPIASFCVYLSILTIQAYSKFSATKGLKEKE